MQPERVLFVCQHGSAKSVIAAEYFARAAQQRGLQIVAESAGLDPYVEIPEAVVAGLAGDGIDVRGRTPLLLSEAALARAQHVVTFGCDLSPVDPGAAVFDDWADVPAVSEDYERARSAIAQHVQVLLERIAPSGETLGQTLILTRSDVQRWLDLGECINAVEWAFRMHGQRSTIAPGVLSVHVPDGGYHIKTAGLTSDRSYFAAKVNANYPHNRERYGRPTIQGAIALFDADTGALLALLDSIEITAQRTAAATAVAARYLARADAAVVTICGCGEQGRSQLRALTQVRSLRTVFAYDSDASRARAYADEMSAALGLEVRAVDDLAAATRSSDICVTCTPSRRFFITRDMISPGTFLAAVGADADVKQEIEPELLAENTVVADLLDQCALIGDLHHAFASGVMAPADVHAELAEIVLGTRPGRRTDDQIIIFDSTGTALQDVAAAAIVYRRAAADAQALSVALGS